MILATVDPANEQATLISIPRDLIVPIPGHGRQKINTAHFWGEVDDPGSGPRHAMQTVEGLFGVSIDYYVRVDFIGFERLIDAVGGIDLVVSRPIVDDAYPTADYGTKRLEIPAGPQHLNGEQALEYARTRHSDSDFGRGARQRQVILAAKEKAIQPANLPKLPTLLRVVQQSVTTDIPPEAIPSLIARAQSIPAENITSTGITAEMVIDINHDGTELEPDFSKIRPMIAQAFGEAAPEAPIRVEILNGTDRDGFAAATAERLQEQGYEITQIAQAARSDHQNTEIIDRSGDRHAGAALAKILDVPPSAIQPAPPTAEATDITITLGFDAPDRR